MKNMKRYLLLIVMLLGTLGSWGQAAVDQAAVLKKIIGLQELQPYFPKNADGSVRQLCIVNYPVEFSAEVVALFDVSQVVFRSREAVTAAQPEAYFAVRRMAVEQASATATINFIYEADPVAGKFKMLIVNAILQKENNAWTLTNLTIGGDTK